MSHRPEDTYGYVAVQPIKTGMVTAFQVGDPVPDSTVEDMQLEESGQVVKRSEWEDRPEDEPDRPMERGEMPPHLRDKVAKDTDKSVAGKKTEESATAKTAAAGGSSRKTPEPDKSGGK